MPSPTTSTASYHVDNELTNWDGNALTYDPNGNMTSDSVNTYTWNARNELSSISGLYAASFEYDPFGRRLQKTINGTTTDYLYDGVNPVQELSGTTVTANMLTGLGVDEYFTRTDSAGTSDFLDNALGSTIALADTTGAVQTQYTYSPFGTTSVQGAANANSYQFTGRENDGQGLYYYRARYYDPSLDRFIGQDPLGFSGGGPNLYAYAMNSPVVYVDPTGLHMACTFCQDTGNFSCTDTDTGEPIVTPTKYDLEHTYSGGDEGNIPFCVNQPICQRVPYWGPVPVGTYDIGAPLYGTGKGNPSFNLTPRPGTDTFDRPGLMIHGNLKKDPNGQKASEGCIVTPQDIRREMARAWSNGDTLKVKTCQ